MSTSTPTPLSYASLPIASSGSCAISTNLDIGSAPSDDDEAPLLVSQGVSLEHELFVAFSKRFLHHRGIVNRFLKTFPNLIEAKGCNAHAKLFKRLDAIDFWMGVKGPNEEEIREHQDIFAKLDAIDAWVGNLTSRWAPIQDPTEEMIRGYAWGPGLILDYQEWELNSPITTSLCTSTPP